MDPDKLKIWQAERDSIARRVQHGSLETQQGMEMLAVCDARIHEHETGVEPETEAEELPAETAPAATNVTPLQPVRARRNATRLAQQNAIRDRALAKYRRNFKQRTGRDPLDVHARVAVLTLRQGLPMLIAPWALDSEVGRNA